MVALLVERVVIGTDGLNVRLRMEGLNGLAREMLAGCFGEGAVFELWLRHPAR